MKVLAGLKVVELGQVLAAPFAGAILSDLGADVLKIERPDGGDDGRRMGHKFRGGDALTFEIFNRGKKSCVLDLRSEDGVKALFDILEDADVLLHNMRPDVPVKLGISPDVLCEKFPRLVYCSISAFGETGPMAELPGYEPLIQAFSGLSSTNGGPDDPPMRAGPSICDQGAGMWAVIGILGLLRKRESTGKGGLVTTSLLETAMTWNAQRADAYVNEGVLPDRHRSGHPKLVPYEAFEAADGEVMICCGNNRLFEKLARCLNKEEWLDDPRFTTNQDRLKNKTVLVEQLNGILKKERREIWVDAFREAGIPCALVHSIPEALESAQVQALQMQADVADSGVLLTGLPVNIDGVRPAPTRLAPALGVSDAE